jgi:phage baseplate assembly protein W
VTADFVGAGWAFPAGVGPTGGIALVTGDTELVQAMRLVLSTYPGERAMRPEFGCRLRDFAFRGRDATTANELADEVRRALLRWEPRVDVEAIDVVVADDDDCLLYLDVRYRLKSTNDRRNLVFPFYTIPPDGSDY